MKKLLLNYGGAIIFYVAIIGMVLIISARFNYLNEQSTKTTYAYNN